MAWRDATAEEQASVSGSGKWRDATPDEIEAVGAIRPGDVEARQKQALSQAQADKPIQARERLGLEGGLRGDTVLGTAGRLLVNPLVAGVKEAAGGIGDVASATMDLLKGKEYRGVLDNPLSRAGMGAVRSIASPIAGLTDLASEGGEIASKFLQNLGLDFTMPGGVSEVAGIPVYNPFGGKGTIKLSDIGGGAAQTYLDITSPLRAAQAGKLVDPKKHLSNRQQAARLKDELDTGAASSEAEIARLRAAREAVPVATEEAVSSLKGQMKDVGTREAEQIAARRASQQAAEESVMSIAEAGAREVPTAATIRNQFAKNAQLGEDIGAQFKNTYKGRLSEAKQKFNELYDEALEGADDIQVPAENYISKVDELLGSRGASRPLPTQAEKVAGKAKDILDAGEDAAEQVQKLTDDIAAARDPHSKGMLQGALDEFLTAGELPENPTVRQLVAERQRLKAAQRVAFTTKNDNLYRQLTGLINGITDDIPSAIANRLGKVDKQYLDEFVPLFSKKSVTRAIAEGSPQSVVDSIIRPVSDKKSVEKVQRAWELMDDGGREATKKAFVNKGVESAFTDKGFDTGKFTEWWRKHSDVTGTGDKVLKTVFGAEYGDMKSVVNQLQSARRMSLDEVATELTKGFAKQGDEAVRSIIKEGKRAGEALREGISQRLALGKQQEKAAGVAVKSEEVAQKLMKQKLEKQINDLVGPGGGQRIAQRFESIGSGIAVGGGMSTLLGSSTGGVRTLGGGLLVFSAKALGRLVQTTRGRSLYKAVLRGTPGTSQAAATARQVQNFLQNVGED